MSIQEVAAALKASQNDSVLRPYSAQTVPDRNTVIDIIKQLQSILFEGYFKCDNDSFISLEDRLSRVTTVLTQQIAAAYRFHGSDCALDNAKTVCSQFIDALPHIKSLLLKDIIALYTGDPAAKCHEEVLLCYPGFYATTIYRLAHCLYTLDVPLIPRMMTEFAHEKTGIDIHAGATIGEYFFIDHGTGIVVGETTVIGDHVKLYQGVTLGAKSFELDENGHPVKNIKRHPNIGNNVIIYANATILGGATTVGDNCIIGANVWLTRSVDAGQVVYYTEK